jgi:hypothetical protein
VDCKNTINILSDKDYYQPVKISQVENPVCRKFLEVIDEKNAFGKNDGIIDEQERKLAESSLRLIDYTARSILGLDKDKMWPSIKNHMLSSNGLHLDSFPNATDEEIIIALKNDKFSGLYVKNPSENVQRVMVELNGLEIQRIDNPSKEVQMLAVEQNPVAIKFIQDPCPEAKEIAKNIQAKKDEAIRQAIYGQDEEVMGQ